MMYRYLLAISLLFPLALVSQIQKIQIADFSSNESQSLEWIDDKLYMALSQDSHLYPDSVFSILSFNQNLQIQDSLNLNPILDSIGAPEDSAAWQIIRMKAYADKLYLLFFYWNWSASPCGTNAYYLMVFDDGLRQEEIINLSSFNNQINFIIYNFDLKPGKVLLGGTYFPCSDYTDQKPYAGIYDLNTRSLSQNLSLADSLPTGSLGISNIRFANQNIYGGTWPESTLGGGVLVELDSNLGYQASLSLADSSIMPDFGLSGVYAQSFPLTTDSIALVSIGEGLPNASTFPHYNLALGRFSKSNFSLQTDTFSLCTGLCPYVTTGISDRPILSWDGVDATNLDSTLVIASNGLAYPGFRDTLELHIYNVNLRKGTLNWKRHFSWNDAPVNPTISRFKDGQFAIAFNEQEISSNDIRFKLNLWLFDKRGDLISIQEQDLASQLSLYPNPSSDRIWISGEELDQQNDYLLFSLQGKLLRQGSLKLNEAISMKGLTKGTYLLKVNNNPPQRIVIQ